MAKMAIIFILLSLGATARSMELSIDNNEAPKHMTGRFCGFADPALEPVFDDNGGVAYIRSLKLFEEVQVDVDFDANRTNVQLLWKDKSILFSGQFNDEGIAYMKPTNPTTKAIAGLRCTDQCHTLTLDIGIKTNQTFQQEQFTLSTHHPELCLN